MQDDKIQDIEMQVVRWKDTRYWDTSSKKMRHKTVRH